jgi:hypothetical protein
MPHKAQKLAQAILRCGGERCSNNSALFPIVEVERERSNRRPVGVGEVVVTIDVAIYVAPFLVEPAASFQFASGPHIYVATINQEEAQFGAHAFSLNH